MLIGRYYHTLQAKGRLAVPAHFRRNLGDQPILSRGVEPCLQLLPFNIWSLMTQSLGTHPLVSRQSRDVRRLIGHNATEVEFDDQGRISIPQDLCTRLGFRKKVVIAGSIDWIEIWDVDTYHTYLDKIETQTETLTQPITSGESHVS